MVGGKLDVGKKNECESEEETNKKESVYREKEKEKRVKKRRKLEKVHPGGPRIKSEENRRKNGL